ncbi:MAG: GPP34 family phosphoprotein [Bacteroidota bacterium]
MSQFLSIPEEIFLLAIEDNGGISPHSKALDAVLASAVLMDLAIRNRIDSDLEYLIPVRNEACSDLFLDEALHIIFESTEKKSPAYWVARLGMRADEFKEMLISSLVVKRILKVENQKVLWLFSSRKYPVVGDTELKEVKTRIRDLVFSNALPDLQDMAIVSLIHYGNMESLVFSDAEIIGNKARIEQIARMDLIGQSISKALHELAPGFHLSAKAKEMLGVKTPQEKLDQLVEEVKIKYHITKDSDLPDWLQKGTAQYHKTLEFIEQTGTNDIYYHHVKGEYFLKSRSSAFSM